MPLYSPVSADVTASGPTLIPPTAREIALYGRVGGLKGWWEADNGLGKSWCVDPGAVASFAWRDRKSLLRLIPKGTQKPIIAGGVVNGRAALQFGHGGALLQGSANGGLYHPTASLIGLQGYAIGAVYRLDTSQAGSAANYLVGNHLGTAGNNGWGYNLNETGGAAIVYHQTGAGAEMQVNAAIPNGFVTDIVSYDYPSKELVLYRNGALLKAQAGVDTEISSAVGGDRLSVAGIGVGAAATGAFSGEIAALMIWGGAVHKDATLFADFQGHLKQGWATWV